MDKIQKFNVFMGTGLLYLTFEDLLNIDKTFNVFEIQIFFFEFK